MDKILAKEAFNLDDVKLSESEYPDAVKALVFPLSVDNYGDD